MNKKRTPLRQASRAFLLILVLGLAASAVAIFVTTYRLGSTKGQATVSTGVLNLTFFRATRSISPSGDSITLSPGLGVLVLDLLLPLALASIVFLVERGRSNHRREEQI